ncbi:MAG: coenzyme F420-0:L-glutamate ligase, partial [Candidatus Methanomethyliaceae archaeon]
MQIFGIKLPIVKPGDDLVSLTIEGSKRSGTQILNKDILVFSAKVVGISQGRIIELSKVTPSDKAKALAVLYNLDPSFVEVVLRESDAVL